MEECRVFVLTISYRQVVVYTGRFRKRYPNIEGTVRAMVCALSRTVDCFFHVETGGAVAGAFCSLNGRGSDLSERYDDEAGFGGNNGTSTMHPPKDRKKNISDYYSLQTT